MAGERLPRPNAELAWAVTIVEAMGVQVMTPDEVRDEP